MRKLLVDQGHSKRFPGAFGVKSEIDWNRAIFKEIIPLLNKQKWDIQVVPTDFWNDWSSNQQLINRINWINKRGKVTDWLLSLHGNAASNPAVRGVTTCFMGGSGAAKEEASKLSAAIARDTGMPVWNGGAFDDRDGRFGRIGMVRDTTPFALLVEAGFCTNAADMAIQPGALAIAIATFFNDLAV